MKYLLILFATIILALIVTGCVDVELEYEKTNEGEKLLEDNSKMNHDDLLIQTMQATKKRYDEKYESIKKQEQPKIEELEKLSLELSIFKIEVIQSQQTAHLPKTVAKLKKLETTILQMQNNVDEMMIK